MHTFILRDQWNEMGRAPSYSDQSTGVTMPGSPENVEEAAEMAVEVESVLYGEFLLTEATLNAFDQQQALNREKARELNAMMVELETQELEKADQSIAVLVEQKQSYLELMTYYEGLMERQEADKLSYRTTETLKEHAADLARAVENIEADINQARNQMEITKETFTSARLNYEERVEAALEKSKALYDEVQKNLTVVQVKANEFAQFATAVAIAEQ